MLRPYQQRTIDQLYDWFRANLGNPCLVMPTGSGKSHIVAALCKDALQQWPETRILMLTHVKELIEQNAQKMRQHWANAPMGIYSASIGKRQVDAITFAGIQTVKNKALEINRVDLCIIDECHLVSHKDEGSYRKLINDLKAINPAMRVVGLTATPYRLNHGLITDGEALFDDLIEPVSIEELIYLSHLAPLHSKVTTLKYDLSKVHKRGGEYIEAELQKVMNDSGKNIRVVREILALAGDRKAWLLFCSGVDHAHQLAQLLNAHNIPAACVDGGTPKAERERILSDYKSGKYRAITNCQVLTTGFDYPDIDLIAMIRPTMSPSLYVQMAGRGMRPKSHTDHCLVLDFAGVVAQHGPITAVEPPSKGGSGDGEAPVRVCDECHEICHISAKVCPACGYEFPLNLKEDKNDYKLRNDDIMGLDSKDLQVQSWVWRKHTSKASGKEMLVVTYYGGLSDKSIREYFAITHDGYARQKALESLDKIAQSSGLVHGGLNVGTIEEMADNLNAATPPCIIEHKRDGKFDKVLRRHWA